MMNKSQHSTVVGSKGAKARLALAATVLCPALTDTVAVAPTRDTVALSADAADDRAWSDVAFCAAGAVFADAEHRDALLAIAHALRARHSTGLALA